MARSRGRPTGDDWRQRVERWVDAGIVSPGQAERIVEVELAPDATLAAVSESPRRGLTPTVEVVSYLGIVLVAVSAFVFESRIWTGMALGWRFALAFALALAGLTGGRAMSRFDDAGAHRLAGLAWLVGTGGVAIIVELGVDRLGRHRSDLTVLCVGVAIVALSVVLWRNKDRPLQFLSFVAGAVMVVVSATVLANAHPSVQARELFVWCSAVLLSVLGVRRLRPTSEVLFVGETAAIIAAIAMTFTDHVFGLVLGLVTTTAATALGLFLKRAPVSVVGVLGYFMIVIRVFALYLRGPAAILSALVVGIALVVLAIWHATRGDHLREGAPMTSIHLFHRENDVTSPR